MDCVRAKAGLSIGQEWVVDAMGCNPIALRDLPLLQTLFHHLLQELQLRKVNEPLWHQFPGEAGVTGMFLLAESHLTVHTFPEHGALMANLYCCQERPRGDWEGWLHQAVGAQSIQVRRLIRGHQELEP